MKLGYTTQKTSIRALKINGSPVEIYSIALAIFSLQNNLEEVQFFEKAFLLINTSMEVVLEILFLVFSNTDLPENLIPL